MLCRRNQEARYSESETQFSDLGCAFGSGKGVIGCSIPRDQGGEARPKWEIL